MKIDSKTIASSFLLFTMLLYSMFFVALTSSKTMAAMGGYDPWIDNNDDGEIDIFDAISLAGAFGTSGTPLSAKAAIEYDSGWIDITDKRDQYFNVTHNLNSTDIIVDITGKTANNSGIHQLHLGGTGFSPEWNQTYGGTNLDSPSTILQTVDGGYALAGYTRSFGAGNEDFWLVKTDATGHIQWNKTYGGPNKDFARCAIQTSDGGYALIGQTDSFGANYDFWLVKTDLLGNVQWNKTYGELFDEYGRSVIQTADGGYASAGTSRPPSMGYSLWLVKVDSGGNMQWNSTFEGGTGFESAYDVIQTIDGGYALVGSTESLGAGLEDFWFIKTDSNGNAQWNTTYGGAYNDRCYSIVQTFDGGYALAGYTLSFGAGNFDFWLVKTDSLGNAQWNKTYGTLNQDRAFSFAQTSDGGYAIAGDTYSFSPIASDFWLVKTNSSGHMQWNKTYGHVGNDIAYSLVLTSDGGYAMVGGADPGDFWVVKTGMLCTSGLVWTGSTADVITLYRGSTDAYWNYVRVRIWKIRDS